MAKLLLDFDGTLTDADAEAAPALEKWNQLFSEKSGIPPGVLEREIEKIKVVIRNDPKAAWMNDGQAVAPATADPYILHTAAYQRFMHDIFPRYEEAQKMRNHLFAESYKYSGCVFRPGAKEFLDKVTGRRDVFIVTNSKTDAVKEKLQKLGYSIPVIGNARKYVNDPSLTSLPESVQPDGFPRPVLLRRRHYGEILDGFNPGETVVTGDIYELDIALAEYLGFTVVQIQTPNTPVHEVEYHKRKGNFLVPTLEEAADYI